MKLFGTGIIILCTALTWGCTVHSPQVTGDPVAMPDRFVESLDGTGLQQDFGRWWERFGDNRLNSLVDEALKNNHDLEKAFARLRQAEAQAGIAFSHRFPAINLQAEADRTRRPGRTNDFTADNYAFSAAASYEIDFWNKFKSGSEAGRLRFQAAGEDMKTLYVGLTAEIVDLYFFSVEQRAQLNLVDAIIASEIDTLERVERRYLEGLVPAVDVYQSRQSAEQTISRRPVYEAALSRVNHAISVLLGRFPDDDITGRRADIPEIEDKLPHCLPSELLKRRPDIQSAILRLKARDFDVAVAVADRFPSFNLAALLGRSQIDSILGLTTGTFWSLLSDATMPLFDAGRRKADIERAQALFQEDLAGYKKTVLRSVMEVEDALSNTRNTSRRVDLLKNWVLSASEGLRLAEARYFWGLTDYIPVLAAQKTYLEAQSQLIAARRQEVSNFISLMRALGGDWMDEDLQIRKELGY